MKITPRKKDGDQMQADDKENSELVAAQGQEGNMNNIKRARILAGMKQAELAEELGITPQQINNMESGARNPGPKMLPMLAQALGVSEAYLRGMPQSLPVYDWGERITLTCQIMREEEIDGYGMYYLVQTPDDCVCAEIAVLIADGVQFTPRDWQGAQPMSVDEIADCMWVDPHGNDAIMLDGLPRMLVG